MIINISNAQTNNWVENNFHTVSTDATQTDFSDLQFLKEELKSQKIVAIGEQTHKDGKSFEARNRLIQFLIKEMGYEAILFEAGMFDVNYGANEAKKSKNMNKLRFSLWAFWGGTRQNHSLFSFLKNQVDNGNTLDFDGFDCKIMSYAYEKKYLPFLDSLMQNFDNQVIENLIYKKYRTVWIKVLNSKGIKAEFPKLSKKEITDFKIGSEFVVKALAEKYPFYSQMTKINDKGVLMNANQPPLHAGLATVPAVKIGVVGSVSVFETLSVPVQVKSFIVKLLYTPAVKSLNLNAPPITSTFLGLPASLASLIPTKKH